ncbi:MAG: HAD family phosphatase [Acidimicrobiia bacterium]|nr:HAD family phosphatase [Acidimicrobiia bacterium]
MADSPFDVVLFDLGGVLIELRGVEPMRLLSGIDNDDELWERWLTCPWVRAFERGDCDATAFAEGIIGDWGLTAEPAAFLDAFRDWPVGPMPGATELVDAVRARLPVGCLSNTNALHTEEHFSRWPIFHAFDHRLLSYELGLLKPDRELFERVAEIVGAPPGRILFLDDNVINVEGATAAGVRAVHTRGVEAATRALVQAGVLG